MGWWIVLDYEKGWWYFALHSSLGLYCPGSALPAPPPISSIWEPSKKKALRLLWSGWMGAFHLKTPPEERDFYSAVLPLSAPPQLPTRHILWNLPRLRILCLLCGAWGSLSGLKALYLFFPFVREHSWSFKTQPALSSWVSVWKGLIKSVKHWVGKPLIFLKGLKLAYLSHASLWILYFFNKKNKCSL